MNIKELSVSTVLLALLYFTAFSFYRGYSDFYGFPTSFISVGVVELVKFSVISLGIMFSLIALLQLDTTEEEMPLKWSLIFLLAAFVLVFATVYVIGGSGYLFERNLSTLVGRCLLLGAFGLIGMRSISVFSRNGYKIKNKSNAVMLIAVICVVPNTLGWFWAYLPYEPLYYSKNYNAYVLDNYSGKFVLGRCLHNKASYLYSEKLEGELVPAESRDTQELKTCFLKAARQKTPRD